MSKDRSKQKHTPGPWVVYDGTGIDREKNGVTVLFYRDKDDDVYTGLNMEENAEANAARIVACVNAMEGIDDPEKFVIEARNLDIRLHAIRIDYDRAHQENFRLKWANIEMVGEIQKLKKRLKLEEVAAERDEAYNRIVELEKELQILKSNL
jgi:hypothetical protein